MQAREVLLGAEVLDLYAGTGALGLEALSRGATHVTFVESDRRALEVLARNIDALRERDRTRIVSTPAAKALGALEGKAATLVMCDPPYADVRAAAEVLRDACVRGIVAPGSTVVLEHATRDPTPAIVGCETTETRVYGDTTLAFYRTA